MAEAIKFLVCGLERGLVKGKARQAGKPQSPESVEPTRAGRPLGLRTKHSKQQVKLRLEPGVPEASRACGDRWQTRRKHILQAALRLAGQLPG
ncbi:BrnA antitoxin family protein [Rhizobacter sp. AJA081-3]|uniref:BrnA antitoxin family protein n=1 Tax=Rhizobacter sp. AJA081-3 TaxID=2753607 RepID=UPI001AE005C9|nr:BrnA antitoxin family protein [Rhizobacter sp. AJA081-3]QTN22222.1 BrnA antitoxin family protein [Rhizobacter sp. AJA081-3]